MVKSFSFNMCWVQLVMVQFQISFFNLRLFATGHVHTRAQFKGFPHCWLIRVCLVIEEIGGHKI